MDFLPYAALCGLFPPERNILKNWSKTKVVFDHLINNDKNCADQRKNDVIHALARYFLVNYSETSKYAQTLLKEGIVDQKIISREEII